MFVWLAVWPVVGYPVRCMDVGSHSCVRRVIDRLLHRHLLSAHIYLPACLPTCLHGTSFVLGKKGLFFFLSKDSSPTHSLAAEHTVRYGTRGITLHFCLCFFCFFSLPVFCVMVVTQRFASCSLSYLSSLITEGRKKSTEFPTDLLPSILFLSSSSSSAQ